MKNMKSNVGSFATAKLKANSRRLFAIIALVAVIGFSMACSGGDGGGIIIPPPDGGETGETGGGTGGGTGDTGDGGNITWTAITQSVFGSDSPVNAIAYGNEKFVAGGANGKIAVSTDGTTWTEVDTGTIFDSYSSGSTTYKTNISEIAYGGGKFVAGCGNGTIATSTDGETWTAVADTTFGTRMASAIVYGGGKFIAGCGNGKMATSTDGETWTAVTQSVFGSDRLVYAIAYGDNKFVASDINPSPYTIEFDSKMAASTDGETWTAVTQSVFGSSDGIYAIAYGGGKFVAGGSNGKMAISTDGETWTAVTHSVFDSSIGAIAYGGGKFVAGSFRGKMAYLSDN